MADKSVRVEWRGDLGFEADERPRRHGPAGHGR